MVQIHAGRLAAGGKSLRKAPPCMHCCQPCRQSGSRRVLSTVANLIWVFSKVTADALQTCLGRLEIQRQLRRAVHGKSDASEPQCTIQNTVKAEKTQAWSSRENDTPDTVQKASNHNPTYPWKRASKMVQQDKKPNEFQNALPGNCTKTVDKRSSPQSCCTLTQLLAEQRETVHTLLFFHFPTTF